MKSESNNYESIREIIFDNIQCIYENINANNLPANFAGSLLQYHANILTLLPSIKSTRDIITHIYNSLTNIFPNSIPSEIEESITKYFDDVNNIEEELVSQIEQSKVSFPIVLDDFYKIDCSEYESKLNEVAASVQETYDKYISSLQNAFLQNYSTAKKSNDTLQQEVSHLVSHIVNISQSIVNASEAQKSNSNTVNEILKQISSYSSHNPFKFKKLVLELLNNIPELSNPDLDNLVDAANEFIEAYNISQPEIASENSTNQKEDTSPSTVLNDTLDNPDTDDDHEL